jgi:hypothetical protein
VSEAPDFFEPFEAWRVWQVVRRDGEYSLRSVVQPTLWPPGRALVAECLAGSRLLLPLRRRKRRHDAPDLRCECGIYAAALERIGPYVAEAPFRSVPRVLGRVALWGTVIECERGCRGSYAYPTKIYVPADAGEPWRIGWDEVALGLCRYGVPVEPLTAPAVDATRFLADRQAA